LGNDVTIIVFKEGTQKFDPSMMKSQFTRIKNYYSLSLSLVILIFQNDLLFVFFIEDVYIVVEPFKKHHTIYYRYFPLSLSLSYSATSFNCLFDFVCLCLNLNFLFCRLAVANKKAVPPYGPFLPDPPVFLPDKDFRDFLLTKREYLIFSLNSFDLI
jgi:hypothetical protein